MGRENTLAMLKRGKIAQDVAAHYLGALDACYRQRGGAAKGLGNTFSRFQHILRLGSHGKDEQNDPVLEKTIADYELVMALMRGRNADRSLSDGKVAGATPGEIASPGFQIERELIQAMFENGRLWRENAKEMRDNLSLMEIQFKKDEPWGK